MSKNKLMAKVRNLFDTQQQIAFTEHDLYQRYVETFKTSVLGRIKSLLLLREMAISFELIEEKHQVWLLLLNGPHVELNFMGVVAPYVTEK